MYRWNAWETILKRIRKAEYGRNVAIINSSVTRFLSTFVAEKKNQNIIGASQWQKQFCLLCRTITTDSQELIETRQVPFGIRLIWVRSSTIVALTNVLTLIQKSLDTCLLWKKRLLGYTFYITRFQHFILIHSTKSQHILIRLSNLWIKDKINAQSCIHILTIILPKISKFTVTGSTGTRCSLCNRYFNRLINQNKKLFPYYRLMTQRHLMMRDEARQPRTTNR